MTLKQKTLSGFIWSFMGSIAGQGITFIVGIILARILSPKEFGLIGMLAIFIGLSLAFVESGFPYALIQRKNLSEIDISSVFYFI